MTEKTLMLQAGAHKLIFCNQRSADWTHLYQWDGNGSTLARAGCGVFSLIHAGQWLTGGMPMQPEELADYAVACGGRGDDGTDRPVLLGAMQQSGLAARFGFRYEADGLLNDRELLWRHMAEERGAALCNLRPGHIVCLVDTRVENGERQYLAIDSYAESSDARVRLHVCEVLPSSQVSFTVTGHGGVPVGEHTAYGIYWVTADTPADFNLLHRVL